MVSMLGMVIGVASLITVLSVMNGFGASCGSESCPWCRTATWRMAMPVSPGGRNCRRAAAITRRCCGLTLHQRQGAARPAPPTCAVPCSPPSIRRWRKTFRGSRATMVAGSLESLGEDGFNVVLRGCPGPSPAGGAGGFRRHVTVPRLTVTPLGDVSPQQTSAGERPVRGRRPTGWLPGLCLPGHRAEVAGPARACRWPAGENSRPVCGARHHGASWPEPACRLPGEGLEPDPRARCFAR